MARNISWVAAAVFVVGALFDVAYALAQTCAPTADASGCASVACPSAIPEVQCVPTVLKIDGAIDAVSVKACACMDFNECRVVVEGTTPVAAGYCPDDAFCLLIGSDVDGDGSDESYRAECVSEPLGACCADIDDGPVSFDTCQESSESACTGEGAVFGPSVFHGPGTSCAAVEAFEACCLGFSGSNFCMVMDPLCCVDSGGVPQGRGSTCKDTEASGACDQVCGGFAGIPCDDGEFCRLAPGTCCCDFQGYCRTTPEACITLYDPVCGCDGVTYGNDCDADAAGVSIDHYGECARPCSSILGMIPLCTNDEYCHFPDGTCDDGLHLGHCTLKPDTCTEEYDPVCGCDEVTYDNTCHAAAAGISVARLGECNPACGGGTKTRCAIGYFCKYPVGECDPDAVVGVCLLIPTECPDTYFPVCGCDGITYTTECNVDRWRVSIAHTGECEPICGGFIGIPCEEGEFCKYPPETCNWADHFGTCTAIPTGGCPENYDPICGCKGVTYGNPCEADAAGASIDHDGACGRPCSSILGVMPCFGGDFCHFPDGTCDDGQHLGVCEPTPTGCPDHVDPVCGCDGETYGNECEALTVGVSINYLGQCSIIGPANDIPAVSEWGVVVLTILVLTAGTIVFRRPGLGLHPRHASHDRWSRPDRGRTIRSRIP